MLSQVIVPVFWKETGMTYWFPEIMSFGGSPAVQFTERAGGVGVDVAVFVSVEVSVCVAVDVGVFVRVAVAVAVAVLVDVGVFVRVDVAVGVFVRVAVGVFVRVGVAVGVFVRVGVEVGVFVLAGGTTAEAALTRPQPVLLSKPATSMFVAVVSNRLRIRFLSVTPEAISSPTTPEMCGAANEVPLPVP